jgi:predicted O-methyltransferase YrrM
MMLLDKIVKKLHLKTIFYSPVCFLRLKMLGRSRDLNKLTDFVFSNSGLPMRPIQVKSEIMGLLSYLKDKKPRYALEIGTARGGTLYLFTRVSSGDATIISVDLPGGKFGGGYPSYKIPIYHSFALPGQKIELIRASSHEESTLKMAKERLGDNKLDFLFIDGDHTYEGAKKDYETYSALVREGGTIALHDITPCKWEGCEVDRFWNELKAENEHVEFVEDWKQGYGGIGGKQEFNSL